MSGKSYHDEDRHRRIERDFTEATYHARIEAETDDKEQQRDAELTKRFKCFLLLDEIEHTWADDDAGDDVAHDERLLQNPHKYSHHSRGCYDKTNLRKDARFHNAYLYCSICSGR